MGTTTVKRGYGDITPALTRDQWAEIRANGAEGFEVEAAQFEAAHIATFNDRLPDSDRRKLGWDYVDKLRGIGERLLNRRSADPERELHNVADGQALITLADILASYLPPRD